MKSPPTALPNRLRPIAAALAAALLCHLPAPADGKAFSQETVRNTSNEIDQRVAAYLQKHAAKANPVVDDATFVRRAYLSISGRIPTADEAGKFLRNPSADKRKSLVDSLVHSSGYRSRMFNFWADLLRLQTNQEKFGLGWHSWIHDAVETNIPYDVFVHQMLSANGLATENPAVGYYLRDRNMLLDNVSNTAQIFLGTRIGCAQCHDHPFDDFTQKQYYEFAAFLGGTTYKSDAARHLLRRLTAYTLKERRGAAAPRRKMRRENGRRNRARNRNAARKIYRDYASLFRDFRKNATAFEPGKQLKLPHDYQYNDGKPGEILTPKTLFGEPLTHVAADRRQQAFADWVTSRSNPRFTRVIVNRLWAEVFGRGIVEPLDNWSDTTRVSHPELLDYLCEVMKAADYDVREFMRVLYHTRLFETAVAAEQATTAGSYNFRGPVLRRMSAEQLHDSMLALEFGNRDGTVNRSIKNQWKNYAESVRKLLHMPLPQLVALNQAADAQEKKLNAARAEARKMRQALAKAKGEGNTEKAAEIQRQLRRKYREMNHGLRQTADGDAMMSMMARRKLRSRPRPFLRSSEQPAPARPGSFMRQFGASDRELANSSHTHASIPQALTLLNGREVARLTRGKGRLARSLRGSQSASGKLDTLFLSIYGCFPTDSERRRYQPMMADPRQVQILAKAMLNSKRFLFVQ